MPRLGVLPALLLAWTVARAGLPRDATLADLPPADELAARPEKRVAVAAHSAILLGLFNTVFAKSDPECKKWFGTGEMRTVKLTFTPK